MLKMGSAHFGMCQDFANGKALVAWGYEGSKNVFSPGLSTVWKAPLRHRDRPADSRDGFLLQLSWLSRKKPPKWNMSTFLSIHSRENTFSMTDIPLTGFNFSSRAVEAHCNLMLTFNAGRGGIFIFTFSLKHSRNYFSSLINETLSRPWSAERWFIFFFFPLILCSRENYNIKIFI